MYLFGIGYGAPIQRVWYVRVWLVPLIRKMIVNTKCFGPQYHPERMSNNLVNTMFGKEQLLMTMAL